MSVMTTDDPLSSALQGRRIRADEAPALWDRPLLDLAGAAHALRLKRANPTTVTYLVDRNINYTNSCVTVCKFCAFYRYPGHSEVYVLNRETIAQKIEELLAVGGTRILLQGGHNPDLRLDWYLDLLKWLRSTFPRLDLDAFSPSEIDHIARLEGLSMEQVLGRLQEAGLTGLPGGGRDPG